MKHLKLSKPWTDQHAVEDWREILRCAQDDTPRQPRKWEAKQGRGERSFAALRMTLYQAYFL